MSVGRVGSRHQPLAYPKRASPCTAHAVRGACGCVGVGGMDEQTSRTRAGGAGQRVRHAARPRGSPVYLPGLDSLADSTPADRILPAGTLNIRQDSSDSGVYIPRWVSVWAALSRGWAVV